MSNAGAIRRVLTRIHLWVGEALGLTHYRSCWGCVHCHEVDRDTKGLCLCDFDAGESDCYALADPCEAVWCHDYEGDEWAS